MKQYQKMLEHVINNGVFKGDRTGTGTTSIFGHQVRYDLQDGFPIVTTKKVHLKSIIHELLWFLKGDTNIRYLKENGVHIWDEWADEKGDLGPVYGAQWRSWPDVTVSREMEYDFDAGWSGMVDKINKDTFDQVANVIDQIKDNPNSRRLIVSAWNPTQVENMSLPPCHLLFQFYVSDGKLSCQLYQRSADAFLGVPFNIASYALLTMMIAQVCDLQYGEFIHTFGDLHIYSNHMEQVDLQLSRKPYSLPVMRINPDVRNIDDFKYEDFELVGYEHDPLIKGKVAI